MIRDRLTRLRTRLRERRAAARARLAVIVAAVVAWLAPPAHRDQAQVFAGTLLVAICIGAFDPRIGGIVFGALLVLDVLLPHLITMLRRPRP